MDDKVIVYTFNDYEQGTKGSTHCMVVRIPRGLTPEEVVEFYHRIGRNDAHIEQSNEVKPCGGCREFGSR